MVKYEWVMRHGRVGAQLRYWIYRVLGKGRTDTAAHTHTHTHVEPEDVTALWNEGVQRERDQI